MTKKDYVKIAKAIKENGNPSRADIVALPFIEELCRVFGEDNPRFDETRFKEATGFGGMFDE